MRKIAALTTGAALALSFPVASSADRGGVAHNGGGVPQSEKPCPAKGKKKPKKPAPNDHGKKCGFAE
jgi:hypothetical protein